MALLNRLSNGLQPAEDITEEEINYGLKSLLRSGLATQAFVTFTGGPFVVAFALTLGASNFAIGLLAAIPPLAQLLQIPSVYLLEKMRNRRFLSVVSTALTRLLWIPIAALSLIASPKLALMLLIFFMGAQSALGALSGASWNSWMRDLVPQEQLGRFFSYRMMVSAGFGALLSLFAGFFVENWTDIIRPLNVYSFLFFVAVIPGMLAVYYLSRVPEPRMPPRIEHPFPKLLAQPFRETNFRALIVFLGIWNFAINLAAPFFTVQMLKELHLPISLVIVFGTISQVANLFALRKWGRLSDKFSNKTILQVASPVFLACMVLWTFTRPPQEYPSTYIMLTVIHILMGIATAGITLASSNIGLKLAPRGHAASYMGALGATNALAAGLAPIIGGRFADFFNVSNLTLTLDWHSRHTRPVSFHPLGLQGWDFFFLFAFLIGLFSLRWLASIKETGEVEEEIVLQEIITQIRREMRNLSTIGGLRRLINFPTGFVNEFRKSFW
jgi:MFS family permease